MGGEVAEQFGFLIKALWSGQYRHIAPREFKTTIGRFAQQFSGTSQQDSQEFLAFLMDGLHEDLNKVRARVCCVCVCTCLLMCVLTDVCAY